MAAAANTYPVQYKIGQLDVGTQMGTSAPAAIKVKA